MRTEFNKSKMKTHLDTIRQFGLCDIKLCGSESAWRSFGLVPGSACMVLYRRLSEATILHE